MPLPIRQHNLVKELAQSSWMMWAVLGMRADWLIADLQLITTVTIVKMLVLVATGLVRLTCKLSGYIDNCNSSQYQI